MERKEQHCSSWDREEIIKHLFNSHCTIETMESIEENIVTIKIPIINTPKQRKAQLEKWIDEYLETCEPDIYTNYHGIWNDVGKVDADQYILAKWSRLLLKSE